MFTVFLCLNMVAFGDDALQVALALHPMAASVPALNYPLLPSASDRVSGNAAVQYGKVNAELMKYFNKYVFADKINSWQRMPLDKLRQQTIPLPDTALFFLDQGARCTYCDWQLPIGQMPFFIILVPDAEQSVTFARVLSVKARIEISKEQFEEAIKTFQTSYALGRNVAQGETFLNGVVGININGEMFPQIAEFIQQPKAPNLYWSLTALSKSQTNMSGALDAERLYIELSIPELRHLDSVEHSPKEWRHLFQRVVQQVSEVNLPPGQLAPPKSPEELDSICERLHPIAQKQLIAAGMSSQQVKAMLAPQAALLYMLLRQHKLYDSAAKYFLLPYPEANKGIESAIERANHVADENEVVPLATHALSELQNARDAIARNDHEFALLRVFEALRIYAAAHSDGLPSNLSDIAEVPVPDDPITGKPFAYRRGGELCLPRPPCVPGPFVELQSKYGRRKIARTNGGPAITIYGCGTSPTIWFLRRHNRYDIVKNQLTQFTNERPTTQLSLS